MADEIKIKVPDIGGATDVDIIEVLVKPGDEIAKDTPMITLESDKASMEIPAPQAGKISAIQVKVGDKVSEGDLILTLQTDTVDTAKMKQEPSSPSPAIEETKEPSKETAPNPAQSTKSIEVCIPDIGGATDVDVIEIMVNEGQTVSKEQALITLEGDKATMDIPSPAAGIIETLKLKVGDKVSQGSLILTMKSESSDSNEKAANLHASVADKIPTEEMIEKSAPVKNPVNEEKLDSPKADASVSAGPSVRRMARELGVNLADVKGTGRKSRISKEDVQLYIKTKLSEKQNSTNGFSLPTMPVVDFSKFGDIDVKPLNKIKRLTGVNVHRSWITIPHVTQFDEADITDLEAFRKAETESTKQANYKLTILAFVVKVVAKALAKYPQFNASLDSDGLNLIYKHYYNIGIAVETPNGLVVPVIKQVNQLAVSDIAIEMARLSTKARDKGLMPTDMNGGCFTVSSLGGIGGTAFTPIVNSPEVAILGLSRSSIKPVFDKGDFKPRLMLPLSLSYDHRVIDGAEAARFSRYIADLLSDVRRILL